MINVQKLLKSANATQESFGGEFKFADLPLKGSVKAEGKLMKVKDGIAVLFDEIKASQAGDCVRCNKKLNIPLKIEAGQWIFYDKRPAVEDDANEFLRINMENKSIDLREPLRQEILLHLQEFPNCNPICKEFVASDVDTGVKALSGLKDLKGLHLSDE